MPNDFDEETRHAIEALHPQNSQLDALPEIVDDIQDFRVDVALLSQVVKDLPKESGVGLSPWTYDLIQF
jgi:hypothetical protein